MQSFAPLPDGCEPTAKEIEAAVANRLKDRSFEAVVFAGLGEPTLRLSTVLEAARLLRCKSLPLRLNTNGLGCLVHKRDIIPELKESGIVSVSVSINTADPNQYPQLMNSEVNYFRLSPLLAVLLPACRLDF